MLRIVKRHLVAMTVFVAVLAGAVGIAIAQVGGGPPESPEGGVRGVGVPKGPFVDFCPTSEQTEEHLQLYGFDYKPTVACTSEGEVQAGEFHDPGDVADDPDENLSDAESIAREKQELLNSRPAPDADGDPTTVEGVGPDGEPFTIQVQTSRPEFFEGMTPAEFAEKVLP